VGIDCGRTGTAHTQVATLHLPLLGSTGLASNTVSNSTTSSGGQTKSNSTLADVNLLGGLIKADAVKVNAQVTDTNGTTSGSTSMILTNATIAGKLISIHPSPNTHINLAGIGDVYLNESSVAHSSSGTIAVDNGIDIHVTVVHNVLGVPVGTRIVVGHASSQIVTY
jgi:pectate lyase